MRRRIYFGAVFILVGASAFMAWACTSNSSSAGATSDVASSGVKLYTYRNLASDAQIFQQFESRFSEKVDVESAPSEILFSKFVNGELNDADVILFDDVMWAERAKKLGLLQMFVDGPLQENVPRRYTDDSDQWIALGKWALGVVIPKREAKGPMPAISYQELKKRPLAYSAITKSLFPTLGAEIIVKEGPDFAAGFIGNLRNSKVFPTPPANDMAVFQAVADGEAPAALVNGATFYQWRNSGNPKAFEAAQTLVMTYPVDKEGKTYFHLSVAVIPKKSAHLNYALQLIKFLTSQDVQSPYCEGAFEFPVNIFSMPSDILMDTGVFLENGIDWSQVTLQLDAAETLVGSKE